MTGQARAEVPAAAGQEVLGVAGVSVSLSGRQILDDVSCTVGAGQFTGLIGPNGAGKTTLLRVILGLQRPSAGTVTIGGRPRSARDRSIGYVPQKVLLDPDMPIRARDLVALGIHGHRFGMRRCPHSGFSFARRTTRRATPGTVGGRPGLRRMLVSYLPPASLRCQARSVASVTGKIPVQRLRGRSRASAANHTRSPGSYRTRPIFRRSTAFSCRSTSNSASFARSPRNTRTARPSTRHVSR